MAIDSAAKRRNANRMTRTSSMTGLSPSLGLDTADRVNAGRGYIGVTYSGASGGEPISTKARVTVGIGVF